MIKWVWKKIVNRFSAQWRSPPGLNFYSEKPISVYYFYTGSVNSIDLNIDLFHWFIFKSFTYINKQGDKLTPKWCSDNCSTLLLGVHLFNKDDEIAISQNGIDY